MIGGNVVLGADPSKARRALNLLFQELTNRGVNLWTLEYTSETLASGTTVHTLPTGTVDVLDIVVNDGSNDIQLQAIGYEDYLQIPNKTYESRPTQYMTERNRANVKIRPWPVPDQDYTIKYWKIAAIQDVGTAQNDPDVPNRFLPAIIYGLAYFFGMRRQVLNKDEAQAWNLTLSRLKEQFEESLMYAQQEDRSRVDLRVVPRFGPS